MPWLRKETLVGPTRRHETALHARVTGLAHHRTFAGGRKVNGRRRINGSTAEGTPEPHCLR
jgi:hypothetical protein